MPAVLNVYISYAHGDQETPEGRLRTEVADDLLELLKEKERSGKIKVIIDREYMTYKSSISEFMKGYGREDSIIILIISDKYLRSRYCMNEVVEITSNKNYHDRIFPVILPDAKVNDEEHLINYQLFWQEQKKKLSDKFDKIEDKSKAPDLFHRLKNLDKILSIFDEFVSKMGDLITVTPPDYTPLLSALEKYISPLISIKQSLPDYYAYRCDRKVQYNQFMNQNKPGEGPKINWYCIYGDDNQAHKSLCERLARELGDYYINYEDQAFRSTTKLCVKQIIPDLTDDYLRSAKQITRELALKFIDQSLVSRAGANLTLVDLLQSPTLFGFSQLDYVFVRIHIKDDDWCKDSTPKTIDEVVRTFLMVELPPDSPRFYFFFCIEYLKEFGDRRSEMDKSLRQFDNTLPALEPVKKIDVTHFFKRHSFIIGKNKNAGEMVQEIFKDADIMDMNEIETKLLELISNQAKEIALAMDKHSR